MEPVSPNQTAITDHDRHSKAIYLDTIAYDIRVSYIWVVFLLGFPGNVFSIITVLSMQVVTPATIYVALLALCDGLTLVTKLVGHQMKLHQAYFGSVGCKAFFITSYLSVLGNWILVLICAERWVSMCFPLTKHIIFTKRRVYISSAGLASVLLVIFSVVHCLMRDVTDDGLECGTVNQFLSFWTPGWYWINCCLHLFIPLPIIIILTVLIIRAIQKSRRERVTILRHVTNNERTAKETERLERNLTIMLILVAVVFLVLSLPACIYVLTFKESSDVLVMARWKLFDQIQYACVDSSHAVNFFLYFFSTKKFRDQNIFLVTCHRWPESLRKVRHFNGNHSTIMTSKLSLAKSGEDISRL